MKYFPVDDNADAPLQLSEKLPLVLEVGTVTLVGVEGVATVAPPQPKQSSGPPKRPKADTCEDKKRMAKNAIEVQIRLSILIP
jgi:hypothetical protein